MRIVNIATLNASLNFLDSSVYLYREADNLILGDFNAGKRTLSELVNDPSGDHSVLSNRNIQGQHSIGSVYGTEAYRIPYQDNTNTFLTDSSSLKFDGSTLIVSGFLNLNNGLENIGISSNGLRNSSGSYNIGIGASTLSSNLTGTSNTAIGSQALQNSSSGNFNIALGRQALYNNLSDSNIALGSISMYNNTLGNNNIAIGYQTLYNSSSGGNSVAIGYQALYSTLAGGNHAVGYQAMYSNTTGVQNTALGASTLRSNTTGVSNTAIGYLAQYSSSTADNNTAIGFQAMWNNTESRNTAIGAGALLSASTGTNNVAIGYRAAFQQISGNSNIVIGASIDTPNLTASNQLVIGDQNLIYGDIFNKVVGFGTTTPGTTTKIYAYNTGAKHAITAENTYIGNAGWSPIYTKIPTRINPGTYPNHIWGVDASGNNSYAIGGVGGNIYFTNSPTWYYIDVSNGALYNIGIGQGTMSNITTGSYNIAIGYLSMNANTIGTNNVAVGALTLGGSSGSYNVAIGRNALGNNQGSHNIGIDYAMYQNTTGTSNIGIGYRAAESNTTGSNNTVIGTQALFFQRGGGQNVAIGNGAGLGFPSNTSPINNNTFIGYTSAYNVSTGGSNTAVGYSSLYGVNDGSFNTAIGYQAGYNVSSGSFNIFIGPNAGLRESGSYKLYIDATTGTSPTQFTSLIYGEFDNKIVRINGQLQIDSSRVWIDSSLGNQLVFFDASVGRKTLYELANPSVGAGSGASYAYVDGSLAARDSSISDLYNRLGASATVSATSGTNIINIYNASTYTFASYTYSIYDNAKNNLRAGQIIINNNSSTSTLIENCTSDIGDTSTCVFRTDINSGNARLLFDTSIAINVKYIRTQF